MSHWYITLPSNSSHAYFPNNTMTAFTTRLQSTCSLNGDWEAALVDMTFPKTWYTIGKSKSMKDKMGGWFSITSKGHPYVRDFYYDRQVPSGYYETVQDVIKVINDIFARLPTPQSTNVREKLLSDSRHDEKTNAISHYFPKIRYVGTSKKCTFEMMENQTIQFSST